MKEIVTRPIKDEDREWIGPFLAEAWGTEEIVSRGKLYNTHELPGFIAFSDGQIAGVVTYNITGDQCEIVTLNSFMENIGAGWANINAVKEEAASRGCGRLWLITSNDNIHAIRYYQKRGFTIAAIHCNAIEKSRELKPQIPMISDNGIPIRDEIEFEMKI